MRSPVCYLAHPIDFQSGLAPNNADYVRQGLRAAGFVVYTPGRAFALPLDAGAGPAIHSINQYALSQCDALVAMYPERESIGVPMELQRAIDLGLPALVISKGTEKSWTLAGLPDTVRITTYLDKAELFDWLEEAAAMRMMMPPDPVEQLFFQVGPDATLPTRAYSGDAGFDLYCSQDWTLPPNGVADIPCDISVQLPDRVWGLIVGRSSTLRKHNLLVNTGIIDTGYRGPLFVNIKNLGVAPFEAKRGMRLGQLIPLPNLAAGLVPTPVDQLTESDRSTAGFGSSGE